MEGKQSGNWNELCRRLCFSNIKLDKISFKSSFYIIKKELRPVYHNAFLNDATCLFHWLQAQGCSAEAVGGRAEHMAFCGCWTLCISYVTWGTRSRFSLCTLVLTQCMFRESRDAIFLHSHCLWEKWWWPTCSVIRVETLDIAPNIEEICSWKLWSMKLADK